MEQKNTHYLAFDEKWFEKNQSILLWFLNSPIIKYLTRYIFRIQNDLKADETICEISPNNYKVYLGMFLENKKLVHRYRADFRTHDKFSKRVYYAFKPIWWAMHYWDEFFADRFAPQFSFGFDTLTAYPDAHTETYTVDGEVGRDHNGDTWAQIRDGAGTYALPSNATMYAPRVTCYGITNQFSFISKGIVLFKLSGLGTVSGAVLSLCGTAHATTGYKVDCNIYASTPASNTDLVAADYQQVGSTAFSTAITYDNFSIVGYNAYTFNSTGLATIANGIVKYGFRDPTYDVANSAPTWGSANDSYLGVAAADNTGTTSDPKLVVTYTTVVTNYVTMSATENSSISLSKLNSFYRVLSVSEAATSTMSNLKSYFRSLSSSVSGVSTLGVVRPFFKTLSSVEASVASISKLNIVGRILSATENSIASMTRSLSFFRTLSASITGSAAISKLKSFFRALSATAGSSATIDKGFVFTIILSATATGVATFSRIITYCRTLAVQVIGFTERIKMIMNGITVGVWSKSARVKDEWSKSARVKDEWTKSARVKDSYNKTLRDL